MDWKMKNPKSMIRKKIKNISPLAAVLMIVLTVGITLALLKKVTNTLYNAFGPGIVNIAVDEDFKGGDILTEGSVVKKVRIKNSKEEDLNIVPAYIRVQLVATWMKDEVDENGNVRSVAVPVDPMEFLTYELNLADRMVEGNVEGYWVEGKDGYYYFTEPVDPENLTDYLLERVSVKEGAEIPREAEGGYLQINVLADAIQAEGSTTEDHVKAVNDAWDSPCYSNGETPIYKNE